MRPDPRHYIYVAQWPGFFKVGCTSARARRYRTFVARGARVSLLVEFANCTAYDAEWALHAALTRRWPLAFADRAAAVPYLGAKGAGWTECYRVADRCLAHCLKQCPNAAAEQCTYVRNVLTTIIEGVFEVKLGNAGARDRFLLQPPPLVLEVMGERNRTNLPMAPEVQR